MVQTTIFEKIGIFFQLFFSSWLPLLCLAIGIVIYYLKTIKWSPSKKQVGILYGIFAFIVLLLYYDPIFSSLDYVATNLLKGYYFPDYALYYLIILFSHILFASLFCFPRWTDRIKKLLCFQFAWFECLFVLFFHTASKYQIELSNQLLVYQNKQMLSLLEFTMFCFIIFLIIFGCFIYLDKDSLKKKKIVHREKAKVKVQPEVVVKEDPFLEQKLSQLKSKMKEDGTITTYEMKLVQIHQKKDMLKIYKKMLELRLATMEENEDELTEIINDLDWIFDECESNLEQNIDELIDSTNQKREVYFKQVDSILEKK